MPIDMPAHPLCSWQRRSRRSTPRLRGFRS
jgi:hypothetical protein